MPTALRVAMTQCYLLAVAWPITQLTQHGLSAARYAQRSRLQILRMNRLHAKNVIRLTFCRLPIPVFGKAMEWRMTGGAISGLPMDTSDVKPALDPARKAPRRGRQSRRLRNHAP
jgi:hypothetical protein